MAVAEFEEPLGNDVVETGIALDAAVAGLPRQDKTGRTSPGTAARRRGGRNRRRRRRPQGRGMGQHRGREARQAGKHHQEGGDHHPH